MKKLLLTAAFLGIMAQSAAAQMVTVEGVGLDRESALRDAQRNAVEQVAGTLVDSRSIAENMQVTLDEIYTKSQGFITKVEILSESERGEGNYRIVANIDVDTSPNAELVGRLQTVMALNDPRIAVIVLHQSGEHDASAETAMNARLLDHGFRHVVDADIVASLEDARLLERIYNGGSGITEIGTGLGADFVVLGKSTSEAKHMTLPDFKGGYHEHGMMSSGRAELAVKIIRFDTGDIVGTFSVEGKGTDVSPERAENKALKDAAAQAADQLEKKFHHIASAAATDGIKITASAWDYGKVEALAEKLRSMGGVKAVTIREHRNGKAILFVDSVNTPASLARDLRQVPGVFVEGVSGIGIQLILS